MVAAVAVARRTAGSQPAPAGAEGDRARTAASRAAAVVREVRAQRRREGVVRPAGARLRLEAAAAVLAAAARLQLEAAVRVARRGRRVAMPRRAAPLRAADPGVAAWDPMASPAGRTSRPRPATTGRSSLPLLRPTRSRVRRRAKRRAAGAREKTAPSVVVAGPRPRRTAALRGVAAQPRARREASVVVLVTGPRLARTALWRAAPARPSPLRDLVLVPVLVRRRAKPLVQQRQVEQQALAQRRRAERQALQQALQQPALAPVLATQPGQVQGQAQVQRRALVQRRAAAPRLWVVPELSPRAGSARAAVLTKPPPSHPCRRARRACWASGAPPRSRAASSRHRARGPRPYRPRRPPRGG